MPLEEKAIWIQQHVKHYNFNWLIENPKRLNAMFEKHYMMWKELQAAHIRTQQNYVKSVNAEITEHHYKRMFGTDYTEDFKSNRSRAIKQMSQVTIAVKNQLLDIREVLN